MAFECDEDKDERETPPRVSGKWLQCYKLFRHRDCIILLQHSPFSTTPLFIHTEKCNTAIMPHPCVIADDKLVFSNKKRLDEEHCNAGLESGVTFLHTRDAGLSKQWKNMTTAIFCHPCYASDDVTLSQEVN